MMEGMFSPTYSLAVQDCNRNFFLQFWVKLVDFSKLYINLASLDLCVTKEYLPCILNIT